MIINFKESWKFNIRVLFLNLLEFLVYLWLLSSGNPAVTMEKFVFFTELVERTVEGALFEEEHLIEFYQGNVLVGRILCYFLNLSQKVFKSESSISN